MWGAVITQTFATNRLDYGSVAVRNEGVTVGYRVALKIEKKKRGGRLD